MIVRLMGGAACALERAMLRHPWLAPLVLLAPFCAAGVIEGLS